MPLTYLPPTFAFQTKGLIVECELDALRSTENVTVNPFLDKVVFAPTSNGAVVLSLSRRPPPTITGLGVNEATLSTSATIGAGVILTILRSLADVDCCPLDVGYPPAMSEAVTVKRFVSELRWVVYSSGRWH
jgi:hypothetical protein